MLNGNTYAHINRIVGIKRGLVHSVQSTIMSKTNDETSFFKLPRYH